MSKDFVTRYKFRKWNISNEITVELLKVHFAERWVCWAADQKVGSTIKRDDNP